VEGLPQDYVIQALYSYCKRPVYKKYQRVYNAECCVCGEGTSAGRKRRLFYFPDDRYFYCFNCSRSWSELNWIHEISKKTIHEILKETRNFVPNTETKVKVQKQNEVVKHIEIPSIPDDAIDICDAKQVDFYKDNKFIKKAIEYCQNRRLFTAVNKPKSLYVSFKDKVHKNRLIVPFYGESGKIECYQSRTLDGDTYPKYLTKYGEKNLYGENNIDSNIPYIFIFEGPIDAMFVKNGVAVGGSSMTDKQESFIKKCVDKEIIYVYDNDKNNKEMAKKIKNLIKQNKKLFVWPKEVKKFKDVNEICCNLHLDELPYKFIIQNSYSGVEALMKQKTT
jgi:5S rRNA maturation endonuclease (ribonuclease M5)